MSRSGIWQLRKLKLQYCDLGGSSRGMRYASAFSSPLPIRHSKINLAHPGPCREFLETRLPEFQKKNPQVLVDVVKRRNRHPHLSGEYRTPPPNKPLSCLLGRSFVPCGGLCGWRCAVIGREKSVGVGGLEADEVEHYIYHLRNQWGLKSRRLGAGQIISQRRSVQGVWNPFVKYD